MRMANQIDRLHGCNLCGLQQRLEIHAEQTRITTQLPSHEDRGTEALPLFRFERLYDMHRHTQSAADVVDAQPRRFACVAELLPAAFGTTKNVRI
ncbi:hypothetical protein XaFJ1_GM001574 [Xanthomonas albilineans]|nr:hypothetical protein XaFJ1_GM001574 [Xanthomonas albilineans]